MRLHAPLIAVPFLSLAICFAACANDTIVKQVAADPSDNPSADDGGSTGETFDAGAPDAAPVTPPTEAPSMFAHVESRGGSPIATPTVVAIVFQGDSMASQITSFTQKLAVSDFWKTAAAEYGVGAITARATITVNEAAPTSTTDQEIVTWIQQKLSGSSPEFGTPDPNTLYAVFYPASTNIRDIGDGNGASCTDYGGYHDELTVNGKQYGYAVLPRCSDITDVTVGASHEYFEWATDPFPESAPAYNKLDDQHWAWEYTMMGELGDLCTYEDGYSYIRPNDIGFQVQRMWSNKASLAGTYPCAPDNTAPYYAAITQAPDDITVQDLEDSTKTLTTKAVTIDPGGSRTVDVTIYSGPTFDRAGLPLRALSQADALGTGQPSGFTYSLSQDSAAVGDTIQVTIKAPTTANAYDMLMMMAQTGEQSAFFWPVVVTNQKTAAFKMPAGAAALRTRGRATKLGMVKPARPRLFRR